MFQLPKLYVDGLKVPVIEPHNALHLEMVLNDTTAIFECSEALYIITNLLSCMYCLNHKGITATRKIIFGHR